MARLLLHLSTHMWEHWVIRANFPEAPFTQFELARQAWDSLGILFPKKICAVLMPNHLHLILPKIESHTQIRRQMGGFLSGLSRRNKRKNLWQVIPKPSEIPDRYHLKRNIRYVALNPCRKGLCTDPLSWLWSTHRDLMGAAAQPQVQATEIAQILREPATHFQVRFHGYVSGDPSVKINGTSAPKNSPIPLKNHPNHSLHEILLASAAALRVHPNEVRRKATPLRHLFVHLAAKNG